MAEMTETFEAAAYTANGTARERVPLPATLFDGTVNMPVMQQVVKAFLANQRQGNASTKTRRYVTGGNQKPWKQKGTGRARQGSTRAPHWVGGGTVFGPLPRSYAQSVPKQVRALARKSAMNARARDGMVFVVDRFEFEAPKTARMAALVTRMGLAEKKVLVLTDGVKPNVYLSARNLTTVHVMPYGDVSTYHVLWADAVVIEAGALGQTLEPIAEPEAVPAAPAAKRATTKRAAKRAADEGEAPAGAARKKTAAKKASAKSAAKTAQPAAKKTSAKPAAKKKKGE